MKIAIVYDWVTTRYGGAEKVLLALHEAFPEAPLFTAVANPGEATWSSVFDIKTSWIQKIPWLRTHHRWLAFLLPVAFESFDLSEFDVIISVTSSSAKGIITKPEQLHICYLLTPPRYLYSHSQEYQRDQLSFPGSGLVLAPIFAYLRWWDRVATHRPDVIFPISNLIKHRCSQYYDFQTEPVVYPPVESLLTSDGTGDGEYYLVISRLVPYKRIDLAIQVCQKMGRKLVIIGDGPDKDRLDEIAEDNPLITFKGRVGQGELQSLLGGCKAVLMPGVEDFGITACEAVAAGKPVILHHKSGAAEIIRHLEQGVHLPELSLTAMTEAIQLLEENSFQSSKLKQSMRKYVTTTFVKNWRATVDQLWQQRQEKGLL